MKRVIYLIVMIIVLFTMIEGYDKIKVDRIKKENEEVIVISEGIQI